MIPAFDIWTAWLLSSVRQYCLYLSVVGNAVAGTLLCGTLQRIKTGMRPNTLASYEASFRLFLACCVFMNFHDVTCIETVIVYLEFLVVNGLSAASVQNHLTVLHHYFTLYQRLVQALSARAVTMFCRSIKINSKMNLKMKGVFTIPMLTHLIHYAMQEKNGHTYRAIFLFAFFTFTRLASLVPNSVKTFDKARLPLVKDIIWAKPAG